jgi:hypothetical protein
LFVWYFVTQPKQNKAGGNSSISPFQLLRYRLAGNEEAGNSIVLSNTILHI